MLIVLALGWSLPDLRRVVGVPFGSYGFQSTGPVITEVDSGGVADRSGIRIGDRVTIGESSPLAQYELARGIAPYPGVVLSATIMRGSTIRHVRLVADPESASDRAFVALRFALAFLTIGVATALLLTRPDLAAWGFFLYCLTAIDLPGAVLTMALPWKVRTLSVILGVALTQAGQVGGVLFAMTFARNTLLGWRYGTVIALGLAAAVATIADAYGAFTGSRAFSSDEFNYAFTAIALSAMLVGFVYSYLIDSGPTRQRLKWMIGALVISLPANYVAAWYFPGRLSYGEYASLIALQAVVPLTAAYALFRKRVIDIRFVVSRTLVYGSLTALLIAVFSVLDAILSRTFAESQVSLTIDITVALMLGFSLNAAHRRVDSLIDRVLFRERHRAELQLERSATGIVHATTDGAVTDTLARLPTEVLQLAGSAVYQRAEGSFARIAISGRLSHVPDALGLDDPLVLSLRAELQPLRVDSVPLSSLRANHGSTEPVLAIPIAMRGELNGFAVYGAHRSGADIDPDEQRALQSLATGAAVAYDHLEVTRLRARIASLEAAVTSLAPNEAPQT